MAAGACLPPQSIIRFPGDDATLRFFAHLTLDFVDAFFRPLFCGLLALLKQPAEGFSLDLESTIFARERSQEGAAKGYNPRRPGRKSHPLLLAVLGEAPFFARLVAQWQHVIRTRRVRFPHRSLRATARWLALAVPACR